MSKTLCGVVYKKTKHFTVLFHTKYEIVVEMLWYAFTCHERFTRRYLALSIWLII